jgi:hypothetical protein
VRGRFVRASFTDDQAKCLLLISRKTRHFLLQSVKHFRRCATVGMMLLLEAIIHGVLSQCTIDPADMPVPRVDLVSDHGEQGPKFQALEFFFRVEEAGEDHLTDILRFIGCHELPCVCIECLKVLLEQAEHDLATIDRIRHATYSICRGCVPLLQSGFGSDLLLALQGPDSLPSQIAVTVQFSTPDNHRPAHSFPHRGVFSMNSERAILDALGGIWGNRGLAVLP